MDPHPAVPAAVVLGAGVSGLTTAVVLAEAGLRVRVVAELPPARTSSAKAGASWGPMGVTDDPLDPAYRWSGETFEVLAQLAAKRGTGVRMLPGTEAFTETTAPPRWAREVPDFRAGLPPGLPGRYVDGWRYTVPIVDMPAYLDHLTDRLAEAGGALHIGPRIAGVADALAGAPPGTVLVNCTGLGSRHLVPDRELRPSRGQLVLVSNPGIAGFFQDNPPGPDLTYVFPHEEYVVLGGHVDTGDGVHDMAPDPVVAEEILARCREVEPGLRDARVIGHRVGLRPHRPAVRVARDPDDERVLHNYGHGGSGLTLSWGCAREVLRLLP